MKKRMRLEIKEVSAEGSFEGLLSPYGNVDQGADVVLPGAYTKTLQDQGNTRPLLWQHKTDVPIGELTLEDRADGLWCKGQLLMALPEAQKAYLLMKARIVKGLSIGFESIKDSIENGVRKLKEVKLYEGSVVTFPMNESALIQSVKGKRELKGDFNEELNEVQLSDAGYQMRYALSNALSSLFYSGLTREQMISLAETIIQQFQEAYLAFLPNYIDMLTEMYGDMETWSKRTIETKAGAMISAANKEKLKAAHEHTKNASECMKAAGEIMSSLYADDAGDDTTSKEAGTSTTRETKAADKKPEPVADHSAALSLIGNIKALIPA